MNKNLDFKTSTTVLPYQSQWWKKKSLEIPLSFLYFQIWYQLSELSTSMHTQNKQFESTLLLEQKTNPFQTNPWKPFFFKLDNSTLSYSKDEKCDTLATLTITKGVYNICKLDFALTSSKGTQITVSDKGKLTLCIKQGDTEWTIQFPDVGIYTTWMTQFELLAGIYQENKSTGQNDKSENRSLSSPNLKQPPSIPPRPSIEKSPKKGDMAKRNLSFSVSKKTPPKIPDPKAKLGHFSRKSLGHVHTQSGKNTSSSDEENKDIVESLVVNKDMPLDQRTKVAREIYSTELAYVGNLEILLKCYKEQLHHVALQASLTAEQVNMLFPKNLEMIHQFNKEFCTQFEKEIMNNNDVSTVGQTFLKYGLFLKMYNEYSSDYQGCLNHYNKLVKENALFVNELKRCKELSQLRLGYEDLIIMPVQRVPRYSLLLRDLIKHTPETHADYQRLVEAETMMGQIGNYINESIRKTDNARRIQELSAKGARFDNLITPQRFLIREGVLKVEEKGKKESRHFFLFNDLLVTIKDSLMKGGTNLSMPEYAWPLHLVWIQEDGDDKRLYIIGPNEQKMGMKKSKADKFWIKAIKDQIQTLIASLNDRNPLDCQSNESKRYGEYTSPNDEKYEGEWVNGLKHGKGKCTHFGSTYEGQWENGKRFGKGVLIYPTGEIFEGEWKNDLPNGKGVIKRTKYMDPKTEIMYSGNFIDGKFHGTGKLIYTNGDTYTGDFYEGRICGQGSLIVGNLSYEGQWRDDQYDGRGILKYPNGVVYEGQFKNGMKCGKGEITYPNKGKYYGTWLDDAKHGPGRFDYPDGSYYDGEWSNDLYDGKGKKGWANGMEYDGSWSRGLRKGYGICKYPDSSQYSGTWLEDQRHGQGTFMETDGSTYTGEWINGRKDGKGTMTYTNMSKYEGQWQNNKFHKHGTFTGTDYVKSYEGEWLDGKMHGKGTVIFANGDMYKGSMKDNRMHGPGTYTYAGDETSKIVYNGKWNMGLREGKGTMSSQNDKKEGLSGNCDNPNALGTSFAANVMLVPQLPNFPFSINIDTTRSYQ